MNPLHLAARNGPYILVAGLLAGLSLPNLAEPMRPLLPWLVAFLLFVTALRMRPSAIVGSLADLPKLASLVIAIQLGIPLILLAIGFAGGWASSPVFFALLIMVAAPSISGSPNLCLMMGRSPEYAMRLLVVGTAAFPLTVIPVFWMMPELGGFDQVFWASLKLFATIALATSLAVITRLTLLKTPSQSALLNLEGLASVTLAIFVIGLMPSVSAAATVEPANALFWIAIACAANFGAQWATFRFTRNKYPADTATALALIAGNRNIALFLIALPPEVIAPIMVFIGAYQIPMYLTPTVMRRMYSA